VERTPAEPALAFRVLHNNVVVHTMTSDQESVKFDIDDSNGVHQITFELQGKTQVHTHVDDQGQITQDAVINIKNITVDGIEVGLLIFNHAEYTHDFNGNGQPVVEKFYGTMGCNGLATVELTTPIYLWLLENM
jgi:hypothetical protein